MKVSRLFLKNFRNLSSIEFKPSLGLNFIVGKNGQGKTSLLEAVGILSHLKSFRGSKSEEWLKWKTTSGEILGTLIKDLGKEDSFETELKIQFSESEKLAFINQKPYRSSFKYLSQRYGELSLGFHSISFNPSDHEMVRGEPSLRRAYLDRVLSAEGLEYLEQLKKYQRALDQKNALLKDPLFRGVRSGEDLLMSFNEELVEHGAQLVLKRLEWVKRVNSILPKRVFEIAPEQSETQICYVSNWFENSDQKINDFNRLNRFYFTGQGMNPSLEILEQSFWKHLSSLKEAEQKTRHSLVGPHRDDWGFTLGNQWLKGHGSQGETRSALLGLKLTELELFQQKTGHQPVFLLDDFSSELDRTRRSFLMRFLLKSDLQVFVTTTEEKGLEQELSETAVIQLYRIHNEEITLETGHARRTEQSQ